MDVHVVLAADPRSAAAARRAVHDSLLAWGLSELLETAQLLVSELVTNAVLHAHSPSELALTADGHRLHVEVCDESPVSPQLRQHSIIAATGRGMQLLDALASGWGVVSTDTGKCVWFALDATRATPVSPWAAYDVDSVEPI